MQPGDASTNLNTLRAGIDRILCPLILMVFRRTYSFNITSRQKGSVSIPKGSLKSADDFKM